MLDELVIDTAAADEMLNEPSSHADTEHGSATEGSATQAGQGGPFGRPILPTHNALSAAASNVRVPPADGGVAGQGATHADADMAAGRPQPSSEEGASVLVFMGPPAQHLAAGDASDLGASLCRWSASAAEGQQQAPPQAALDSAGFKIEGVDDFGPSREPPPKGSLFDRLRSKLQGKSAAVQRSLHTAKKVVTTT